MFGHARAILIGSKSGLAKAFWLRSMAGFVIVLCDFLKKVATPHFPSANQPIDRFYFGGMLRRSPAWW